MDGEGALHDLRSGDDKVIVESYLILSEKLGQL
jgi:hypothetical protein